MYSMYVHVPLTNKNNIQVDDAPACVQHSSSQAAADVSSRPFNQLELWAPFHAKPKRVVLLRCDNRRSKVQYNYIQYNAKKWKQEWRWSWKRVGALVPLGKHIAILTSSQNAWSFTRSDCFARKFICHRTWAVETRQLTNDIR